MYRQLYYRGWKIKKVERVPGDPMFSWAVQYKATGPNGEKLESYRLRDVQVKIDGLLKRKT